MRLWSEGGCRGIHGLACKFSAGRHPRHNLLNDIICRSLQRAQVPATKEPSGLCRSDGKRPDGVTMILWSRGRCMAWDVTVVDTLAPSHVIDSSSTAGAAASRAEAVKTSKYSALASTHIFIPLALETMGAWGQQCLEFVRDVGRRLTALTGEKKEPAYLKQRISIALQRGNALACRGSLTWLLTTLLLLTKLWLDCCSYCSFCSYSLYFLSGFFYSFLLFLDFQYNSHLLISYFFVFNCFLVYFVYFFIIILVLLSLALFFCFILISVLLAILLLI